MRTLRKKFYQIITITLTLAVIQTANNLLYQFRAEAKLLESPIYQIDYTLFNGKISNELKKEVEVSLNLWDRVQPAHKTFFMVGSLEENDRWGIISMTSLDLMSPDSYDIENGVTNPKFDDENTFNIVYALDLNSNWRAAIDTDQRIGSILSDIPSNELPDEIKVRINKYRSRQSSVIPKAKAQYSNYMFPWPPSDSGWRLGDGYAPTYWHSGSSIDFRTPKPANQSSILAVSNGYIDFVCYDLTRDNTTVKFRETTTGEFIWYGHISASTLNAGPIPPPLPSPTPSYYRTRNGPIGPYTQGQHLGYLVDAASNPFPNPPYPNCGGADFNHVHLGFPSKPFIIDGYQFDNSIPSSEPNPQTTPKTAAGNSLFPSHQSADLCNPSSATAIWTIPTSDCTITSYINASTKNIVIPENATLTITSTGTLDVDLSSKYLKINNGGKLYIENGGSVK